jgi:hypothetical protein
MVSGASPSVRKSSDALSPRLGSGQERRIPFGAAFTSLPRPVSIRLADPPGSGTQPNAGEPALLGPPRNLGIEAKQR